MNALIFLSTIAAASQDCIPLYGDCTHTDMKCCYHSATTNCYAKDQYYAQCLDYCGPDDPRPGQPTKDWKCSHPGPSPPKPAKFECHHYVTGNPICLPGNATNSSSLGDCEAACKFVPPAPGPIPQVCDENHGGHPATKSTGCKCLDPAGSGVALPCARVRGPQFFTPTDARCPTDPPVCPRSQTPDGDCKIPEHDGWGKCDDECCP